MSVTFSGAFTFTGGGFTATLAPPAAPIGSTAGWFGGGEDTYAGASTSIITRITYATDTATSTNRGPLSQARTQLAANGTLTYGWFGGGYIGPAKSSLINRITYTTDTATASVRGPLNQALNLLASTTDGTSYGWFGGGNNSGGAAISTVARIVYATDTATAGVRGSLTSTVNNLSATGNSTDGWYAGGSDSTASSLVCRITYATDTALGSNRGPLNYVIYSMAATGNDTYGWFGGGYVNGLNRVSTIQRITFATDTATASIRGPMTIARSSLAASTDNYNYGWFSGGMAYPYVLPGYSITNVDRITYATDTATASARGNLNQRVIFNSGSSGQQ